jgi:hypothetical protein
VQAVLREAIVGEMAVLEQHRLVGDEPQPFKVIERGLGKRGRAAQDIDILDANQELAAGLPRHSPVEECGIGMAEMKPSIGARSETEARLIHTYAIVQPQPFSQTRP